MKILLVGGTFDDCSGKSSGLINKFYKEIVLQCSDSDEIKLLNGGQCSDIWDVYSPKDYDVILWWPNIPNEKDKSMVKQIKSMNNKVILVTSKRNNYLDNETKKEKEYSFPYLVNHALGNKANLFVEFTKNSIGLVEFTLYDPLGNEWCPPNTDVDMLVKAMMGRIYFLKNGVTRESIKRCNTLEGVDVPDKTEFFEYIKNCADKFQEIIKPPVEVTRFLGNSSFRCDKGFPSFRGEQNCIFVSKRNIDKKFIDKDGFIKVYKSEGRYIYQGILDKPSVDTPIQIRLYEFFTKINYMIHGHVYIKNAPFTKMVYPCGAIEEPREIIKVLNGYYDTERFAVNLLGHGCIIGGETVEDMKGFNHLEEYKFVARPAPEIS